MTTKREQWRLPKTFKQEPIVDGRRLRHDGEPRLYELQKFANDKTLSTNAVHQCCDCGLQHNYTYNVLKTPDGNWYLLVRAYRLPVTGEKK